MKTRVSGVPYEVDIEVPYTKRISTNEYFMAIAKLVAARGTCIRRKVGCVLVNGHKHIIATGYAGVPSGFDHCVDKPCPGALSTSGTGLDKCQAVHAEQNALLQCSNIFNIEACFTTTSPCIHCIKLLLNTSCKIILYEEKYPGFENVAELWQSSGRLILQIGE